MDEFFDLQAIEENKRQNVVLIDYHNLAMRNLFAIQYDPRDVSYVDFRVAMLKSIRAIARDFQPNRIIFCLEAHDRNWRYDVYPEYKKQRAAERNSSIIDFDKFFPIYDNFKTGLSECLKNCQFLTIPHLEADDIIATIVKSKPEWDITLISTDKDFYQLHIYKNFKQYDPIKSLYVNVINPEASLMEKIVRGDKNDNIPSLQKGIGSVKFAKIYSEGLNDWIVNNNLQESFDRNTKLISFKFIPIEYQKQVKEAVNSFIPQDFDKRNFYNFIFNNGLGAYLDKTNDFINTLIGVK